MFPIKIAWSPHLDLKVVDVADEAVAGDVEQQQQQHDDAIDKAGVGGVLHCGSPAGVRIHCELVHEECGRGIGWIGRWAHVQR